MTRIMSTRAKLLASTALLAAAAGAAGLGTFGSFTSTTSASQAVSAGTVNIALGTANTPGNRLTVAAGNIVPGDTIQRTAVLTNSGNQALANVTLTTTAAPSSLLDTDATNGLQVVIQKCATAWTEGGTAPKYTYTCTGGATSVLATRAVIGANIALSGLSSVNASGTDNLMVTMTLPVGADNSFQGLTSTVNFAFTATQRAGTNQ
jgi:spore coat-associated protein N